jgi:hypothetical protein
MRPRAIRTRQSKHEEDGSVRVALEHRRRPIGSFVSQDYGICLTPRGFLRTKGRGWNYGRQAAMGVLSG